MENIKVKKSQNNEKVEYINSCILLEKKTVYTLALFTRIDVGDCKKIALKIGRYKKEQFLNVDLKTGICESAMPKSELTLEEEELKKLVEYIDKNYKPLSNNECNYLSIDDEGIGKILDSKPETILDFIKVTIKKEIDVSDINKIIEIKNREKSIANFQKNITEKVSESVWQKWFTENSWVLGTEFVAISDDRRIDVGNISDFIAKNLDGYVDVIEIKKPSEDLSVFEKTKDHGNYVPSTALTKAITQLVNYLNSLEKQADSIDTVERVGKILKPRGILVYGRSKGWDNEQFKSFRLLNDSLTNITIFTYDMVYSRAYRMNEFLKPNSYK